MAQVAGIEKFGGLGQPALPRRTGACFALFVEHIYTASQSFIALVLADAFLANGDRKELDAIEEQPKLSCTSKAPVYAKAFHLR